MTIVEIFISLIIPFIILYASTSPKILFKEGLPERRKKLLKILGIVILLLNLLRIGISI